MGGVEYRACSNITVQFGIKSAGWLFDSRFEISEYLHKSTKGVYSFVMNGHSFLQAAVLSVSLQ